MNMVKQLILFNIRLLTFRTSQQEFQSFANAHLAFGLFCTWLVGIGRWWDDPQAHLLQHLGLGSVIYVFILSGLIWVVVLPLRPKSWSYRHVLTFVSLTSLPALLYAIPVERFLSVDAAIDMNIWFLGIVALWRVALFIFYLKRHAQLGWFTTSTAVFLPLAAIVSSLAALNLHRVVFDVMGGLRDQERSAHEGEYTIIVVLTVLSFLVLLPLLVSYVICIFYAHRRVQKDSPLLADPDLEPFQSVPDGNQT
ncbi:MAG TPA: hypothetical protein PKD64_11055 [Pirellulaceae bacterium]|nr:hypothetical protein [Pirellulaceae bacterium]HMO92721.1 hypothetical protein [Pirellulaceae bacterium]HMP70273.1 hypothetical protein [Pirellulaceae bacterium]